MLEIGLLIGLFTGAILITFILTRIVQAIFIKKHGYIASSIIAIILVSIFVLFVASINLGITQAIIIYIPSLLICLGYDIRQNKKKVEA